MRRHCRRPQPRLLTSCPWGSPVPWLHSQLLRPWASPCTPLDATPARHRQRGPSPQKAPQGPRTTHGRTQRRRAHRCHRQGRRQATAAATAAALAGPTAAVRKTAAQGIAVTTIAEQHQQHGQHSMQGTPSTRADPPGGANGKHNGAFPSMQPEPVAAAPSSQRHGQDGRSSEGREPGVQQSRSQPKCQALQTRPTTGKQPGCDPLVHVRTHWPL